MHPKRAFGQEHPGFKWGPFTFRVPFYHTKAELPEFLQGVFVAGATGLAIVPLLTGYFGLTPEEAVAFAFIQSMLISSAVIVFGEPFTPGWVTPALPLALTFMLANNGDVPIYPTPEAKFQIMTAVSLEFALILFVFGITGLGKRFITWIPDALKGGIILGAAIAALKRVFIDDAAKFLDPHPVSTLVAISLCLILTFSIPLQRYKKIFKPLAIFASLGLLPGFLIAAFVGPFVMTETVNEAGEILRVPEIVFNIEWGFLIPPFADMLEKVSPFSIGWPSFQMFVEGLPLALIGYVIVFGDLITGHEVLKEAMPSRPDEKIDINFNRSHLSMGIRNVLMAILVPLFPTQGCLWTGVHVIIVQRWKEGRKSMDSLYSGISSYYVFGVPLLFLVNPIVTGMEPLLGIALALTLVLTGFACAYVAMGIPKTQIERGVVILTAFSLAFFASPWIGMGVGLVATFLLIGPSPVPTPKPNSDPETE